MSRAKLLGVVGIGNETRNVRRHLDPLLKLGFIEREPTLSGLAAAFSVTESLIPVVCYWMKWKKAPSSLESAY